MLEIIALIFLTKEIGKIAESKGLKSGTWKIYTVIAWIIGELSGIILGLMIFQPDNLISIMLMGIAGAVTGYLMIKRSLLKKPDNWQDDIDRIGDT